MDQSRDTLVTYVRVHGNQQLSSLLPILIPDSLPYRVTITNLPTAPGDSARVQVIFAPTTAGVFTGQIGLVSDAVNEDTLRIGVTGTSRYLPSAPGNLASTRIGEDMRLTWNRVDTSITGVPLVVDRYLVFFRANNLNSWNFLAATYSAENTMYLHQSVVTHSSQMYYEVRSWIGDTDSFDRIIGTIPTGTPEAMVRERLNSIQPK
ncbi:MAG: hypothetical protein OEM52_07170, partial [bacterium]|nr:hypothetical protein [bacterium]